MSDELHKEGARSRPAKPDWVRGFASAGFCARGNPLKATSLQPRWRLLIHEMKLHAPRPSHNGPKGPR